MECSARIPQAKPQEFQSPGLLVDKLREALLPVNGRATHRILLGQVLKSDLLVGQPVLYKAPNGKSSDLTGNGQEALATFPCVSPSNLRGFLYNALVRLDMSFYIAPQRFFLHSALKKTRNVVLPDCTSNCPLPYLELEA